MTLNSLYGAIKNAAKERDDCYALMTSETCRAVDGYDENNAVFTFNFNNGVVDSLVEDYVSGGGKRNVRKFVAVRKEAV